MGRNRVSDPFLFPSAFPSYSISSSASSSSSSSSSSFSSSFFSSQSSQSLNSPFQLPPNLPLAPSQSSSSFFPSSASAAHGPCASCKILHACTDKCDTESHKYTVVDRVFGSTNIASFLQNYSSSSSYVPILLVLRDTSQEGEVQSQSRWERGDHGSELVKREPDDGDSGHYGPESFLKSEIAKFTDKGGLVDSKGVEQLLQLMLLEKNEKNINLVHRSLLAGVIVATDKFDCLNQFMQLRGLPVLDDWLQEVRKGKIGDGSSQIDKSIEEFILVILCALGKLPVNLSALQMCNIGKSVNHLRTHKHSEIQKRARCLVDTWKKRVEAEMYLRWMTMQTQH